MFYTKSKPVWCTLMKTQAAIINKNTMTFKVSLTLEKEISN